MLPNISFRIPDTIFLKYYQCSVIQYYGNREKLRLIKKDDLLETLNRNALKMARQVADETNTLMAGDIGNSTAFDQDDPKTWDMCRQIFEVGTSYQEKMLVAHVMKRVDAGASPTPWLFEPAKRPDDKADYSLDCSFLP